MPLSNRERSAADVRDKVTVRKEKDTARKAEVTNVRVVANTVKKTAKVDARKATERKRREKWVNSEAENPTSTSRRLSPSRTIPWTLMPRSPNSRRTLKNSRNFSMLSRRLLLMNGISLPLSMLRDARATREASRKAVDNNKRVAVDKVKKTDRAVSRKVAASRRAEEARIVKAEKDASKKVDANRKAVASKKAEEAKAKKTDKAVSKRADKARNTREREIRCLPLTPLCTLSTNR